MATITRSVELSNGIRLPFLEQGDPSGTPVVFLHGVTDSMHSFDLVLPRLPASIHAFALTQRGHGDADRVGHSMGATNALRFAIDHPARTAGLVPPD